MCCAWLIACLCLFAATAGPAGTAPTASSTGAARCALRSRTLRCVRACAQKCRMATNEPPANSLECVQFHRQTKHQLFRVEHQIYFHCVSNHLRKHVLNSRFLFLLKPYSVLCHLDACPRGAGRVPGPRRPEEAQGARARQDGRVRCAALVRLQGDQAERGRGGRGGMPCGCRFECECDSAETGRLFEVFWSCSIRSCCSRVYFLCSTACLHVSNSRSMYYTCPCNTLKQYNLARKYLTH